MEALQKLVAGLEKPKKERVCPKKGTTDRRIIKVVVKNGREHYLHATNGWRSRRL